MRCSRFLRWRGGPAGPCARISGSPTPRPSHGRGARRSAASWGGLKRAFDRASSAARASGGFVRRRAQATIFVVRTRQAHHTTNTNNTVPALCGNVGTPHTKEKKRPAKCAFSARRGRLSFPESFRHSEHMSGASTIAALREHLDLGGFSLDNARRCARTAAANSRARREQWSHAIAAPRRAARKFPAGPAFPPAPPPCARAA